MNRKGIITKKRQNCDDFIETFHKKLKINHEEPSEISKKSSTALILYKEPSAPIPTELPAEILDRLKREMGPSIEKLILSNAHIKIEEVFQEMEGEIEGETEADMEMEVD